MGPLESELTAENVDEADVLDSVRLVEVDEVDE